MVNYILAHFKERGRRTFTTTSSLIAIANVSVNADVDCANNQSLCKYDTTVEAGSWLNCAEDFDAEILQIWFSMATESVKLESKTHDRVNEVPDGDGVANR